MSEYRQEVTLICHECDGEYVLDLRPGHPVTKELDGRECGPGVVLECPNCERDLAHIGFKPKEDL